MELFNPNQMAAEFAPLMNLGTGEMKNPVRAFYRRMASNYNARSANQNTAIAAMNGLTPEAFDQAVADDISLGATALQSDPQTGVIQGSIASQAMDPASMSPVGQMMSGNPQFAPGAAIPEGGAPQTMPGQIDPAEVDNALKRYAEIVAQRPKAPKQERAQLSDGAATLAILVGLFGGDRRAAVDVLAGALQGSQQYADATNKQNVFDFEQELADWEAKLKPAELEAEIKSKLFQSQMTQQGMNQRADMMNDRALTVAGINADARLQNTQMQQQGANQRVQMQLEQKDRQFIIQNASQNERQMLALYKSAPPATRVRIAQTLSQNPLFAGMSDQELIDMASEPTIGEQRLAFNQEQEKARADRFNRKFAQAEKQFGMKFNADQKDRAFKNQIALDQLELARQRLYDAQSDSEFQRAKFDWERQKFEYEQSLVETKDETTFKEITSKLQGKRQAQLAITGTDEASKKKRQELEIEIAELDAMRRFYQGQIDRSTKKVMDDTDAFIDSKMAGTGDVPPENAKAPPKDNNPLKGGIGGNRSNTQGGNTGAKKTPPKKSATTAKPKTQKTKSGTEFVIE